MTQSLRENGVPELNSKNGKHPRGLHCFSRRVPPPPPLATTSVFCGAKSLASALAKRGSADEEFWRGVTAMHWREDGGEGGEGAAESADRGERGL